MKNNNYLISVIIPIYNSGIYLDDCMESLINQTIGFDNIEVIIVNDGSKDNSEEYCLKYDTKYSNVIYIKQINSGVSTARNVGLKSATGKYINFLDSDDKWKNDAFEKGIEALEKYKSINFVSIRRKMFEAEDGYTQFDYMFTENKIVNIFDNFDYIQVPCTSLIIRNKIAKKYSFDKNLILSEDAKYAYDLTINEQNFYVICDSLYYYRIRLSNDSAIQTIIARNKAWYSISSKDVYEYAFNVSIDLFEKIIPYAQYFVMYHLRNKFVTVPKAKISKYEENEYKKYLVKLIKQIDDNIILMQRKMSVLRKIHALNIKYNRTIENNIIFKKDNFYFNKLPILRYDENLIRILNIYSFNGKTYLRGIFLKFITNNSKVYYYINNKKSELRHKKYVYSMLNYFEKYSPSYEEFVIELHDINNNIYFSINDFPLNIEMSKSAENKLFDLNIENNVLIITNKNIIQKKNLKYYIKSNILKLIKNKKIIVNNEISNLNRINRMKIGYSKYIIVKNPTIEFINNLSNIQKKNYLFKNSRKYFVLDTDNKIVENTINNKITNFVIIRKGNKKNDTYTTYYLDDLSIENIKKEIIN